MPYFMLLQPQGLSYPVHVWVDKAAESVRIDIRGGVDKALFIKVWTGWGPGLVTCMMMWAK